MTTTFDSAEMAFSGLGRPVRIEAQVNALEVQGDVPIELAGVYYRVGPDPAYPPAYQGYYPVLDGDGMMVMFRFRQGRVDFTSRYVETERHQLEKAANRALFGRYRNPYTDDPSVAGHDRGQANTTMRMHAGVLLALKEDSQGIAIQPCTLETLGRHDFDGRVTSRTMTAHPKIDSVSGEMVFYGSAAKGETTPDIAFYVADKDGAIVREEWLVAPYASMMHDFIATQDWIVFPVMPTTSDLERIKGGGPIYNWEPERGMYLGIMPRNGTAADVRWIHHDARWFYHAMNAFDDGPLIQVDVMENGCQPFPFLHVDPMKTWKPQDAAPKLTRWTIDTRTGALTTTQLSDLPAEMPRVDERREMTAHRHGFANVNDPSKPPLAAPGQMNSIGHWDHKAGEFTLGYAGDAQMFEEPQYVPRRADAEEADGFVLALRHNYQTMLSDLVIYDTRGIDEDPVAVVKLPFRVRPGTHGTWVPEAELNDIQKSWS